MPNNKWQFLKIQISGYVRDSEKAKGFYIEGEPALLWIPKSQIDEFTESDGFVTFWIKEWLMIEKGLEDYIDTSREPSLFE